MASTQASVVAEGIQVWFQPLALTTQETPVPSGIHQRRIRFLVNKSCGHKRHYPPSDCRNSYHMTLLPADCLLLDYYRNRNMLCHNCSSIPTRCPSCRARRRDLHRLDSSRSALCSLCRLLCCYNGSDQRCRPGKDAPLGPRAAASHSSVLGNRQGRPVSLASHCA